MTERPTGGAVLDEATASTPIGQVAPATGKDLMHQVEAHTSENHRAALRQRRRRDNLHGYIFMAPQLIGLLGFMAFPLGFAVVLAFLKWDGIGQMQFVGFQNFLAIFQGEQFRQSAINTVWFTALQVPTLMISAFVFAVLLQNAGKMRNFYRACFFAPQVTATVAVAVIWLWLLNPDISPITGWLKKFDLIAPNWLQDPKFVIPAVVLVSVFQGLGYQIVMFMAGLQNVPISLMEAADIDGASELQKVFRITLPLISPTILFLSITSIIGSFQVFDYIFVFFDNTAPAFGRTVVYEIYQKAFGEFDFGIGSALAMILFVSLLALTGLQLLAQKKWVFYTE